MSLTRPQQILLKRAQHDAGIEDPDYRDSIATVSGMPDCRSSKDPRLTDEHADKLLKWFESIYWSHMNRKDSKIFRSPGFWSNRNQPKNTSRDRYTESQITEHILDLESQLQALGFGHRYLAAIQSNIKPFGLHPYKAALERTLRSQKSKLANEPHPF